MIKSSIIILFVNLAVVFMMHMVSQENSELIKQLTESNIKAELMEYQFTRCKRLYRGKP